MSSHKEIVICGGGIIGVSTAYQLAKKGVKCTVIERWEIACAASGKAGGFLACDWCEGSPVNDMAKRSFDMHEKIAKELDDAGYRIDYRKLNTFSVRAKQGEKDTDIKSNWLDGGILKKEPIGTTQNTAQVHPHKLSHAMFAVAREKAGSVLRVGSVEGVQLVVGDHGQAVTGVLVDGAVLPCDTVLFAMGPWTGQVAKWLKSPEVTGRRAHRYDRSPEVYPRPDGTVYMCGYTDDEPLPRDSAKVAHNEQSCRKLKEIAGDISSVLEKASVNKTQSCYLPYSPDGVPIIGRLSGVKNAYIATGHSCWGILNCHATGEAMAELMLGLPTTLDLSAFSPERF